MLSHLVGEKEAWCRACSEQEVEGARHLLARCGCEAYRVIRRRWHEKVLKGAREVSPVLEASLAAVVANNDGVLQDGAGGSGLTVWDAVAGRIPILWTAEAERAGTKREDFEKWLRRYGVGVKEYLWKPLWQARQRMERELEKPAVAASSSEGSRSRSKEASMASKSGRGSYRAGARGIARSRSRNK